MVTNIDFNDPWIACSFLSTILIMISCAFIAGIIADYYKDERKKSKSTPPRLDPSSNHNRKSFDMTNVDVDDQSYSSEAPYSYGVNPQYKNIYLYLPLLEC